MRRKAYPRVESAFVPCTHFDWGGTDAGFSGTSYKALDSSGPRLVTNQQLDVSNIGAITTIEGVPRIRL